MFRSLSDGIGADVVGPNLSRDLAILESSLAPGFDHVVPNAGMVSMIVCQI
jgi:hypothetical protein